MADWNPALYLQYGSERSRPAAELLSRVALENVRSVADLGCGPGNSTSLLYQRWPSANITGVDSSPNMLNEARATLPNCHFVETDISEFRAEQPLDLLYANASLQWSTPRASLLPVPYPPSKIGLATSSNESSPSTLTAPLPNKLLRSVLPT